MWPSTDVFIVQYAKVNYVSNSNVRLICAFLFVPTAKSFSEVFSSWWRLGPIVLDVNRLNRDVTVCTIIGSVAAAEAVNASLFTTLIKFPFARGMTSLLSVSLCDLFLFAILFRFDAWERSYIGAMRLSVTVSVWMLTDIHDCSLLLWNVLHCHLCTVIAISGICVV